MRNTYGNLAYDLDRVKSQQPKLEVLEKTKVKKKLKLSVIRSLNLCMGVVIALASVSIIYGYTNLAVLSKEEASLVKGLGELKSEETSLNARVENMLNLGYVENFAKENLSMINIDENQIEHIYIQNEDEIYVNEKSNIFSTVKNIYNNLKEYLS